MTEISSLVPIIKEEIEKERQQTFEAAKEKDKDRTIVPDASLPDGPATWSILKPSPLGKGPLSLRVSIGTSLFTITVSNNGLNSMKSGGYGTRFRKPSDV